MKRIPIFTLVLAMLWQYHPAQGQFFQNPVLSGFYPDPSICQAGDNYYMVNSSFAYFPGLPVFHSKDLVNWKQIGHAMDRPSQLDLTGAGVSRGLFAPAISFHQGKFYIVCTFVDKLGNFVITATNPAGPWSDPVALPEVNGIDPSLFFEEDRAYIVYNSIPPGDSSLWDGHRTIRMQAFDPAGLKVKGKEILLINGGTDVSKKPVWIEGPHIYKKDGYYVLMCAEGGTAYNHSEVVFRSKNVEGPYEPYIGNPILTQRHLNRNRSHPITTTGHADLVEYKGRWFAVFLGCRPYEGDYFNTGRETFMAPVIWRDGWPIINPGSDIVKYQYPINSKRTAQAAAFSGNVNFTDSFSRSTLDLRYAFLRTPLKNWYSLTRFNDTRALAIKLQPTTIHDLANPSFIGFRQPHHNGEAVVSLEFNPAAPNEQAGIMVFQNETSYYYLCLSTKDGIEVVQLFKGPGKDPANKSAQLVTNKPVAKKTKLYLKITSRGSFYDFYYSTDAKNWLTVHSGADAKPLSTESAGGFVGCMYAMYATSNGEPTNSTAYFRSFVCHSMDSIYQKKSMTR